MTPLLAAAHRLARSRWLTYLTVFALAALVAWLSLHPSPHQTVPVRIWDKLAHALAYTAVGFAMVHALALTGLRTRPALLLGAIAAATFGGLIELAQALTPHRTCSALDQVANTVGAAAGAGVWAGTRAAFGPLLRAADADGRGTEAARDA